MRFSLDQRPPSAHRAERWLVPALAAGVVAFPLIDRALQPLVGGVWSVLTAIILVGSPVAALLRMVIAGDAPRRALLAGLALGVGTAIAYGWVFAAPWVSTSRW